MPGELGSCRTPSQFGFQLVAHQRPHLVHRVLARDLAAYLGVEVLREAHALPVTVKPLRRTSTQNVSRSRLSALPAGWCRARIRRAHLPPP